MEITRTSPFTGKETTKDLPVTEEQLNAWKQGTKIQDAMPHIAPADREFIMTGILPEEWESLFGSEND